MWRNVLITAASRRVPLVRAFQRALDRSDRGGSVVVTDVNPLSPAVHVADRAFQVPRADEPGYIETVLDIAVGEGVGLVIPTIDDELAAFGHARRRFAALGIRIAVSDPDTSEVCHDKYLTCQILRACGVPAAQSWLPGAVPEDVAFPLFIKPRRGRGGVGAYPVRDARELAFFLTYVADPVVQQYLDGPEYTIDMLCDDGGRPLAIVPRRREVVRAGVMDRGCTERHPALMRLAEQCAEVLAFSGAVNIQCRLVDGAPVIFEINPRFSGGIPLTIEAGADFPAMLVALTEGRRVEPCVGQFRDGLWMTSYESSLFLDDPARTLLPADVAPIAEVA